MPKAKAQQQKVKESNSAVSVTQETNPQKQKTVKKEKKIPQAQATVQKTQKQKISHQITVYEQQIQQQAPQIVPIKEASQVIKKDVEKKPRKPRTTIPKAMRVKRPATSYAIFVGQLSKEMTKMEKFNGCSYSERHRIIAESWRGLTDEQKQEYRELYEIDKIRYTKEVDELKAKGLWPIVPPPAKEKGGKTLRVKEEKIGTQPKRPRTSYIYFGNQYGQELKRQNPELKLGEISKLNGKLWAQMTDEQKEPFKKLHQLDVIRYVQELKQMAELGYFINSDGIKSTFLTRKGKVMEFEEGTILPKRPFSAYIMFFKNFCKEKKENGQTTIEQMTSEATDPSTTQGRLNASVLVKCIAEKWNSLTDEEKIPFHAMKEQDKIRWADQIAALKKDGFFMTVRNGLDIKSCDLPPKKKKVRRIKKMKEQAQQDLEAQAVSNEAQGSEEEVEDVEEVDVQEVLADVI